MISTSFLVAILDFNIVETSSNVFFTMENFRVARYNDMLQLPKQPWSMVYLTFKWPLTHGITSHVLSSI